jgi:hypothetical protein
MSGSALSNDDTDVHIPGGAFAPFSCARENTGIRTSAPQPSQCSKKKPWFDLSRFTTLSLPMGRLTL